jgi:putative transposase
MIEFLAKGIKDGRKLTDEDGVISSLIGKVYQHCLEGEIDHHLDSESEPDNRRNGYTSKLVKSNFGNMEINTTRDRHSTFEPNIIKKRQTVIEEEIASKILSLYTLGTSYEDIAKHIADLYCIEVSDAMIHSITEKAFV